MSRSVSRELDRVVFLFTQWRDRYPKGKRPPEPLWAEAVALLDRLPLSLVSDRLALSPKCLAARRAAADACLTTTRDARLSGDVAPRVIEFEAAHLVAPRSHHVVPGTPDALLPGRSAVVEIDKPDGTRLRLALPSCDNATLAALCQAFLQTP